jgi:nitrite reductase/ring-hydroxylating ferredoxin subunit
VHQDQEKSQSVPPVDVESCRRDFVKKGAALALGALSITTPVVAGLMVVCDPLRRKGDASDWILVTSMRSLPEDGLPRKFVVIASHSDAWNRNPSIPVGAVYLRRTGPASVQAFNVICPHAGCFVDFVPARNGYLCPCHNSTFEIHGKIRDRKSPSPRGLDQLDVQVKNEREVWVRFQNFRTGVDKRIPNA